MPKPAFNPNQPFQVSDTAKPAFDPSKPFVEASESTRAPSSGILDKIQQPGAAVRAGIIGAIEGKNPLKAAEEQIGTKPEYSSGEAVLQALSRRLKSGGEDSTGAKIGSAIESELKPNQKESILESFVRAQGSPIGAIARQAGLTPGKVVAGGIEAVTDPLSYVPLEKLASLGMGAASKVLGKKAAETAANAVGATKGTYNKLGAEQVQNLGQKALDEGIVGVLSTPGNVVEKIAPLKEEAGKAIGDLIASSEQAGAAKVSASEMANALEHNLDVTRLKNAPGAGNRAMFEEAQKEAEFLRQRGDMSLTEAHQARRDLDQLINFNRKRADLKPGEQKLLYDLRDIFNEAINQSINKLGVADKDALKLANKRYSDLSKIEEIAQNRANMNASNRAISLTDTIAAAGGGAAGGGVGGLAGAAANKLVRTYGAGVGAKGLEAGSVGLGAASELTGDVGRLGRPILSTIFSKYGTNQQQGKK